VSLCVSANLRPSARGISGVVRIARRWVARPATFRSEQVPLPLHACNGVGERELRLCHRTASFPRLSGPHAVVTHLALPAPAQGRAHSPPVLSITRARGSFAATSYRGSESEAPKRLRLGASNLEWTRHVVRCEPTGIAPSQRISRARYLRNPRVHWLPACVQPRCTHATGDAKRRARVRPAAARCGLGFAKRPRRRRLSRARRAA
jgi:hypothetical protein